MITRGTLGLSVYIYVCVNSKSRESRRQEVKKGANFRDIVWVPKLERLSSSSFRRENVLRKNIAHNP